MTRPEGVFASDQEEYIFVNFFKNLADYTGSELPPEVTQHPDTAANHYVKNYDLVIVMRNPDKSFVCFSANYRNRLPKEFTDRVKSVLGLMPEATVFWSNDVFREPEEFPARQVIFGQRPEAPPSRSTKHAKETVRKRWANPKLSQNELDYLKGQRDEP